MTKEQFHMWMGLEETKEFFALVTRRKEILKEYWANEGFAGDSDKNNRALGEVMSYSNILQLTAEDFSNE